MKLYLINLITKKEKKNSDKGKIKNWRRVHGTRYWGSKRDATINVIPLNFVFEVCGFNLYASTWSLRVKVRLNTTYLLKIKNLWLKIL